MAQHFDAIAFVIVNSIEAAASNILAHNAALSVPVPGTPSQLVQPVSATQPTSTQDTASSESASDAAPPSECNEQQRSSAGPAGKPRQIKSYSMDCGYLKPSQILSADAHTSSDLSDTDVSEKPEKVYNESSVDGSSRDERDEASEIENFDLSSYGEDTLEAMYYMIRKNEIIMDKSLGGRATAANKCDDEKIAFPEKATENLKSIFREVSGKRASHSLGSMNSSVDDVVLKQISSDSDCLQLHVLTSPERLAQSDTTCKQSSATDATDDEAVGSNAGPAHTSGRAAGARSMDAAERRAANTPSMSDNDSDYAPEPGAASRLCRHSFNASTAFEHTSQSASTEESESLFESAATRIQASARGYLTRCRLRKGNTSADQYASLTIDNSLDNCAGPQESGGDGGHSDTTDANVRGITNITCEQRPAASSGDSAHIVIDENSLDDASLSLDNNESSAETAQRRLTLQRGDAVQRNSTPEPEHKHTEEKANASAERSAAATTSMAKTANGTLNASTMAVLLHGPTNLHVAHFVMLCSNSRLKDRRKGNHPNARPTAALNARTN